MPRSGGGGRLGAVDRAVIDALLPSGADERLPAGALESGFEAFLVEFDRLAAPPLKRGFRIALLAAGWLAPLLVRRVPPMSRLAPDDREAALAAMESSRLVALRQLMNLLKTVVALHYGSLPSVRRAIGHTP